MDQEDLDLLQDAVDLFNTNQTTQTTTIDAIITKVNALIVSVGRRNVLAEHKATLLSKLERISTDADELRTLVISDVAVNIVIDVVDGL